MIRLFDKFYDFDFGHSAYLTLGQFKNFNIVDAEFHTSEYWSWSPDIRLTLEILSGTLFTVRFSAWSVSFDLDFISYRSPFNLSHTRE